MAFEERGSCYLAIAGVNYANMIKLELRRSKDEMTCEGTITVSWPGAEMAMGSTMPMQSVVDGAQGTIMLDGQLAGTVILDSRTSHGTPDSFRLDFKFRGKSSPIVDGVPDHKTGQENKQKPGQLAKKLMEGYECKLEDKSGGGDDQQIERFIIQEGESVERSIRRACREFGLTASENEQGNVVLSKRGEEGGGGGGPLILGRNFYEWSVKRDISPRHSKIKTKGNSVPTDKKYGKDAEELMGESIDAYVKFKKEMHLLIDTDHDKETLKKRAKTEARRRTADGLNVTMTVSTWSDEGGQLWKVGNQHMVVIPVDGVSDMLMIKEIRFVLDHEQRYAELTLCPKEGFGDSGGGGADSGGSAGAGASTFSPSIGG
jgi:prophage tail gpP-like protein